MYTFLTVKERKVISYIINKLKKVISPNCRICYILFSHMGIIGNMNNLNKEASKYVDKEDYIAVLFHIGFPHKRRVTNYCSGLTSKNYEELEQQIQCEQYPCLQIA